MSTPRQIGSWLVEAGLITADQLDVALAGQRAQGGPLGRHLLLDGSLSRLDLYRALARQWQVPLVDLVAEAPEPGLVVDADLVAAADEGWLPWRRRGDTLVIATSAEPTPQLLDRVGRRHDAAHVEAVATTDWDITQAAQAQFRAHLLHRSAEEFAANHADRSAKYGLVTWQRLVPVALVVALVGGALVDLQLTALIAFAVTNIAFGINVLFKVVAALRAPAVAHAAARRHRALDEARAAAGEAGTWGVVEEDLPVYTVLVPAFREANVIGQVMENIGSLDYPTSKLDVLVLLEEDDAETIAAAKAAAPPEYVRILVVPRGQPQTKPRACNYGLAFARGRYCVIFDAEDRPDPDQLRVAVEAFRRDDVERAHGLAPERPLVCVQAALNYFNADYNVLTRLFAVEYAHWFDAMLPGMDGLDIPLPLGGTSNHFDTLALQQVGAWDPYNVTEDADLGLRVDAAGYRVGTIDSVTWEEATARVRPWIRQRTRWIKGYMMTAAVNLRHPVQWLHDAGLRGSLTMVGLVLGTPLAFLAYPFALGLTIVTLLGAPSPTGPLPHWLWLAGILNLVVSTGLMILVSAIAAWRRYSWRIAVFALLNPLYWCGHAVAAWRAAWQALFDPHRWEKTPHGLTAEYSDSTVVTTI